MESEKPCCPAAAARMMKKLVLPGGFQVGIANLDDILKEVAESKLADDNAIRKELIKKVKIYNYVAPSADHEYSEALFNEYRRQYGKR
ncbi:MAG: hypothetical protein OEV52_00785 [Dehalococcoidia bacterium]|nr:hypothetical protein [Dehalococcoidia bacterium]MDH4291268.1 hypothetical protein [Dehalococcoidia bacterium]